MKTKVICLLSIMAAICLCASCSKDGDTEGIYDRYRGHKYVDLGLSVKWATCNVGANSPVDYGNYYAWGATKPQSVYDWIHTPYQTRHAEYYESTKWLKYIGITSSLYKDANATDDDACKTVLDPEDDAAHVNWGGDWRMPTFDELVELRANCYWQSVSSYMGDSVQGYIVYKAKSESDKGKNSRFDPSISSSYSTSDPHIFLPAAGYYSFDSFIDSGGGCYWSSSVGYDSPTHVFAVAFYTNIIKSDAYFRYYGHSVRPVCP